MPAEASLAAGAPEGTETGKSEFGEEVQSLAERMPTELLVLVFAMLDSRSLLITVGAVCRHWRAACHDVGCVCVDLTFVPPKAKLQQRVRLKDGAEVLEGIVQRFRNIDQVNMSGWSFLDDPTALRLVQLCPRLRKLDFSGCFGLSSDCIALVAERCPLLEEINFAQSSIEDSAVAILVEKCRNLTSVTVSTCHSLTIAVLHELAKNPNLTKVNMDYCLGMFADGMIALAEHCPLLTHISFTGCQVHDSAVAAFAKHCPGLKSVSLGYSPGVTDESLRALSDHCRRLEHVDLSSCTQVTDDGVRMLAEVCSELRSVILYNIPKINDASVVALTQNCSKLMMLDVQFCDELTATGRAAAAAVNAKIKA
eukprot:m.89625 g.89625  ORF g.89625 m.89625 type:complete len:367 (+) comp11761_c0_seq1:175-1275(+)